MSLRKPWRDAATLILLSKQKSSASLAQNVGDMKFDVLLQTRPSGGTFANSAVFPGGVHEAVDGSPRWLQLFQSFGYQQQHFDSFHRVGAKVPPIFQNNSVQRHVELRITAIRETFEELGVLLCSRAPREERTGHCVGVLPDVDIQYWQDKISKDPEELFRLCQECKCYPDIWGLHYWSNWLTPYTFTKRFDTAFFIAAVENKPQKFNCSSEVCGIEWSSPSSTLERHLEGGITLFPPQVYELKRLSLFSDIEELIKFAQERSRSGNGFLYSILIRAKDGFLQVLPGDDLYPTNVDFHTEILQKDKTVLELRQNCNTIHRLESVASETKFIIRNYEPEDHISMGDISFNAKTLII